MAVPSSNLGDLLITNRTEAVLFLPKVTEPSSSFESGLHLYIEAFLEVCFPLRVVGVGFCADFRVPLNVDRRSRQQSDDFHLSLLALEDTSENPTLWSVIRKVCVFHPSVWFVSMSSACPFPDGLEDSMINSMEGCRTHHMAMLERPPTDLWVKFGYQFSCGQVAAFFDTFPDLPKKGLHVLLRWSNPELETLSLSIFAHRLAQKVKSLFNMRHDGLFG